MAQKKTGDWQQYDNGDISVWDGDSWGPRIPLGTPAWSEAQKNGNPVPKPGASANPSSPGNPNLNQQSPVSQQANQQAAVQPASPVESEPVPGIPGKYSSGSKRYPEDIGYQSSDYMIFDFYDYVAPFSDPKFAGTSLKEYNASVQSLKKADGLNQIVLYMPEGVSVSYKANWDGKKFGNIGAGILAASGGFASGDIGGFFDKLGKTASDTAKRAPAQAGAGAISAIIGGITGDSVSSQDIFSSVGGQILNPNAELIFGGHDLRTFTFTYRLVPFNSLEAEIIFNRNDGIISTFKRAMLPSFGGLKTTKSSGSNFANVENVKTDYASGFIKNPKLVQPHFMHNSSNHPYLPRLKPCTITDFDVNYTADGVYAAHDKGYPAAAEISISLIETKLVYAEDIGVGY